MTVDYDNLEENITGAFLAFLRKGGIEVDNFADLGKLRHNQFCAALRHVGTVLFRNESREQHAHSSLLPYVYNDNNIYILHSLIDIYINLCMLTDNDCNLIGFSMLTCYDIGILKQWRSDRLNPALASELQKVYNLRQEMVENKLSDHVIGNTALANNSEELGLKWTAKNAQAMTRNTVFVLPGEAVRDSLQGRSAPMIGENTH